jgi:hypothetical protein
MCNNAVRKLLLQAYTRFSHHLDVSPSKILITNEHHYSLQRLHLMLSKCNSVHVDSVVKSSHGMLYHSMVATNLLKWRRIKLTRSYVVFLTNSAFKDLFLATARPPVDPGNAVLRLPWLFLLGIDAILVTDGWWCPLQVNQIRLH